MGERSIELRHINFHNKANKYEREIYQLERYTSS